MKYKFRFKAQDKLDPKFRWVTERKITEFYEKLYDVKMDDGVFTNYRDSNDNTVYNFNFKARHTVIDIIVNYMDMTVKKLVSDGRGMSPGSRLIRFNNVQLRFFENLGFDLDELFKRETGQNIDDWFKKEY